MIRSNSFVLSRTCGALWALATVAALLALFVFSPRLAAATFTYTNPSCTSFVISGTPPAQTVTCVSTGGGGGGVPVCTPTANPANPAVNQQTTLSANCSNQPTSYLWSGGPCGGAVTATCNVTKSRTATMTFSVTATNASGTSTPAPITVTWQ
jgi:hypothetical protein